MEWVMRLAVVGALSGCQAGTPPTKLAARSSLSAERGMQPPEALIAAEAGAAAEPTWCFRAASVASGPVAVSAQGDLFLATVEGSIHALSREGRFRWSYTPGQPVIGSPVIDDRGRALVAVRGRKLYALTPQGGLAWVFRSQVEATVGLAVDRRGFSYLLGGEHVFAVSSRAGVIWHRKFDGPALQPVVGNQKLALVATTAGIWRVDSYGSFGRISPLVATAPLALTDDTLLVIAAGELVALSLEGERRWSFPGARSVAAGDRQLVVSTDQAVVWLDPRRGALLGEVPLPGEPSAELAQSADAHAVLPLASGELWFLALDGTKQRFAVARAPLLTPRFAAGWVFATAGDGTLCGIVTRAASSRWRDSEPTAVASQGARR